MIPFRFGPPSRQLHGVHHPAAPGRSPAPAVLMCNPFGQEAVRTHRMYRVLADRLARAGVHVLRFDYHGTGDSSGDDTDGNLDIWRDDVLLAHQELQRRALGASVSWLGARLGATLAALAALKAPAPPARLLLWEPVLDGRAYLDALTAQHRTALRQSFGLVPKVFMRPPVNEALGFGMSDALVSGLRALTPSALEALRCADIVVIAPSRDARAAEFAAHCRAQGSSVRMQAFDHAFDWASEEALNTALVPQEAVKLLATLIAPEA